MFPPLPQRLRCAAPPLALLGLLALLGVPAGAGAAAPCLECHDRAGIGEGERSVHPPFGADDCETCHADHGDDARLVLVAEGAALCSRCHKGREGGFLRAHPGAARTRVACTSCHDPHRSGEPHLLRPNRHRPLAYGLCDGCHRYDGRLVRAVPDLCLGCHGGKGFSGPVSHGPVRKGECLVCHDPHVSPYAFLLRRPYAPGREIAGAGDVELCFGCHAPRTFLAEEAATTHFRDGDRNLHLLHVSGAGGKLSCRNCHEAHTAEGPRLVRRELDCDGVPCLRLDFRRSGTGGQCLSGCHAPQSYAFAATAVAPAGPARPPRPAAPAPRRTSAAAVPQPSNLQRSIDRRCVGCHARDVARFAAGARVHAPVRAGACTSCHLDHGPENRLILLGRLDRVCATCHPLGAPGLLAAHRDYPLAGSRCTECHDPHGSDAPGLLLPVRHAPFAEGDCRACHADPAAGWRIDAKSDACRECHDGIGTEARPHSAIAAAGCRGCHRAHAGREPSLLRAAGTGLCFGCHDAKPFAGATGHPPAKEGDCAACHPPHGSAEPGLLARPYPLERFVAYRDDAYELCWECHETSLVDPAGTGGGFGDGSRNLHALHVRDRVSTTEIGRRVQPGIACRNCHDPHATADPRLVRRELDCDGVPCLQLEFRKIGTGGRCSGGCHDLQSYETK